jgi:hypothetical protein
MDNATRRELLQLTKEAQARGAEFSVLDVYNNPNILNQVAGPTQPSMQVASTPQEFTQGLRGAPPGTSMTFPDVPANTPFNTVGMNYPIDIKKYDNQGHLVKSYDNVPPGIQNLPMGPKEGTVIESPAQKQGGGRKAQGGLGPTGTGVASRADSLAVAANAQDVVDFYTSVGSYDTIATGGISSWRNALSDLDAAAADMQNLKGLTSWILNEERIEGKGWATPEDKWRGYRQDVNETTGLHQGFNPSNPTNTFYQRELQSDILNPAAPMSLFDRRIAAQSYTDILNQDPDNLYYGDAVTQYQYDPLAVTPWDMLTDKEKDKRIDKYGTSGTPYDDPKYTKTKTKKRQPAPDPMPTLQYVNSLDKRLMERYMDANLVTKTGDRFKKFVNLKKDNRGLTRGVYDSANPSYLEAPELYKSRPVGERRETKASFQGGGNKKQSEELTWANRPEEADMGWYEEYVNQFLGNPMGRADADATPGDLYDREKHALAAFYTAQKVGVPASTIAGMMHEYKEFGDWESLVKDAVNNAVGAYVGGIPFLPEKWGKKIIKTISPYLPSGDSAKFPSDQRTTPYRQAGGKAQGGLPKDYSLYPKLTTAASDKTRVAKKTSAERDFETSGGDVQGMYDARNAAVAAEAETRDRAYHADYERIYNPNITDAELKAKYKDYRQTGKLPEYMVDYNTYDPSIYSSPTGQSRDVYSVPSVNLAKDAGIRNRQMAFAKKYKGKPASVNAFSGLISPYSTKHALQPGVSEAEYEENQRNMPWAFHALDIAANPLMPLVGVGGASKAGKPITSSIDWAKWHKGIPNRPKLLAEYTAIEEAAKAKGNWMQNFNIKDGKVNWTKGNFEGTPEQFVQFQSDAFRKSYPQGYKRVYRGVVPERHTDDIIYDHLSRGTDKSMFTADKTLADVYAANYGPKKGGKWGKLDTQLIGPQSPTKGGIYEFVIPKGKVGEFKPGLSVDTKGQEWTNLNLQKIFQSNETLRLQHTEKLKGVNKYIDELKKATTVDEMIAVDKRFSDIRQNAGLLDMARPSGYSKLTQNANTPLYKAIKEEQLVEMLKQKKYALEAAERSVAWNTKQLKALPSTPLDPKIKALYKELSKELNAIDLISGTSTNELARILPSTNRRYLSLKNLHDGGFGDVTIVNNRVGNYLKSARGNIGDFDLTKSGMFKGLMPGIGLAGGYAATDKQAGGYKKFPRY